MRIASRSTSELTPVAGFASEVTRVAREVGTEGKLGGQAQVKGVGGVWKDLTDSTRRTYCASLCANSTPDVNTMAANLTGQVRAIADVTTAVAGGGMCPHTHAYLID